MNKNNTNNNGTPFLVIPQEIAMQSAYLVRFEIIDGTLIIMAIHQFYVLKSTQDTMVYYSCMDNLPVKYSALWDRVTHTVPF